MKRILLILAVLALLYALFLKPKEVVPNFAPSTSRPVPVLPRAEIKLPAAEKTPAEIKELPSEPETPSPISVPLKTAPAVNSTAPIASSSVSIFLKVPFTAQAPLANWSDPRQEDACEEAGALMAMAWVQGKINLAPAAAEQEIIALADWEQKNYSENRDVYIDDVADWIFKDYFQYQKIESIFIKDKNDLISALKAGKLILAPTNGQALHNPHFKAPGPERHLLVITGYDALRDEFITNDPGTRTGENYRYLADVLVAALRTYPTGYHQPIIGIEKKVLLVEK